MRICYVVHSLHHFAAPYVDYFGARGHEIHVVSFSHAPIANAVNHHPTARDFGDDAFGNLDYVRAIPAVRGIIRRIAPDLVHAHFLTSNGLVAAAAGVHPLIVSARGSDVHVSMQRALRRAVIRFVMARADLVNPVSAELAALIEDIGVPASKVLCLSQGIDRTPFDRPRVPRVAGAPLRVVCTRKLHHPYRPETIVAALTEATAAGLDVRLTFAAGGRDEAALRRDVAARGLETRVRFLGGFTQAELPALLADADVYVSASLWDGTSPALLEAMAAGAYPIVTDCPANRAWIRPPAGALFPADDPSALASALAWVRDHPDVLDAAGMENRRLVAERADRPTNLAVLERVYERLVAERAESRVA